MYFLKLIAGMRVKNETESLTFTMIRAVLNNKRFNPFLFKDEYAKIISGTEEAMFDWIGLNSIMGTFENDNDNIGFGSLDMGGYSTQIAFALPLSQPILNGYIDIQFNDQSYQLYGHSYLQFGIRMAKQRLTQLIQNEYKYEIEIPNPCLNIGYNQTYQNRIHYGTSNPIKCQHYLQELLHKDAMCLENNCALNGVYMPKLPYNMTFYAFETFGYAYGPTGWLHLKSITKMKDIQNIAIQLCNTTYDDLDTIAFTYTDEPELDKKHLWCSDYMYILVLLRDGYNFDNNINIKFATKINNQPVNFHLY